MIIHRYSLNASLPKGLGSCPARANLIKSGKTRDPLAIRLSPTPKSGSFLNVGAVFYCLNFDEPARSGLKADILRFSGEGTG